MEKEQVVEVLKRPRNKAGKETIKHAKFENGMLPVKRNGKIKMETTEAVKEIIEEAQDAKFERLVKEKVERGERPHKKVKFIPNGTGVDVVEKPVDPPKEKKASTIFVSNLVEAFADVLVTDTDKNSYVNFRYPGSKTIVFYCISRNFGVTVSQRSDSVKSGWESSRLITEEDLKSFVASIRAQVDNQSKYSSALTPIYRCPCGFETTSKTEMQTHVGTHGSE